MGLRKLFIITLSLCLTGSFYFFDTYFTNRSIEKNALEWARLAAAQTEGFSLTGKILQQNDPLGWATQHLNQGHESKHFHIAKHSFPPEHPLEKQELNSEEEIFFYDRILIPEERLGIRIKINTGYHGFLGATSRVRSDIYIGLIFLFLFCSLTLIFFLLKKKEPVVEPSVLGKEKITRWVAEARGLYVELGSHIRSVIRSAQILVNHAAKSKASLDELRGRIYGGVDEIHEAKQNIQETEAILASTEAMILNMVIEAARLGDDGKHFSELTEQLHLLIQKIRRLHQRARSSLLHVEGQIQPWAQNTDQAIALYHEIWRSTQNMNEEIGKTGQALGNQAKHLKTMQ